MLDDPAHTSRARRDDWRRQAPAIAFFLLGLPAIGVIFGWLLG